MGEEAVLADSGRAGKVAARVGWVRSLVFLNSLLARSPFRILHPRQFVLFRIEQACPARASSSARSIRKSSCGHTQGTGRPVYADGDHSI
jgi:hypothetical protein